MKILLDILSYPWRGSGKYMLIICAGLSVAATLAGLAPFIGGIASLILAGYFCALFFRLVETSASGAAEAPDFPEVSHLMQDIIVPMLRTLAVGLISFGPALLYLLWAGPRQEDSLVANLLLALGTIYAPMALLAVAVRDDSTSLSPHIVLPAIFRGGWVYWVAVLYTVLQYVVQLYLERQLTGPMTVGQMLLSHLTLSFAEAYLLMAHARALGLVYQVRGEKLGWG